MITGKDYDIWKKKFSEEDINIMKKKCQNFNCGHYRYGNTIFCPHCIIGEKCKQLSDEDMKIVRKMQGVE